MNETEKRIQISLDFTEAPDLLKDLDRMAADDFMKRATFLKRLIRQEHIRRSELAKAARKATQGRNVAATLQGNQGG